jgi:hypothetical protein
VLLLIASKNTQTCNLTCARLLLQWQVLLLTAGTIPPVMPARCRQSPSGDMCPALGARMFAKLRLRGANCYVSYANLICLPVVQGCGCYTCCSLFTLPDNPSATLGNGYMCCPAIAAPTMSNRIKYGSRHFPGASCSSKPVCGIGRVSSQTVV